MNESLHYGTRPAYAGRCASTKNIFYYFPFLIFDPDEISVTIAKTNTVVCQIPHSPPYQFMTALYQSKLKGKNIKPSSNQNQLLIMPVNHPEKI